MKKQFKVGIITLILITILVSACASKSESNMSQKAGVAMDEMYYDGEYVEAEMMAAEAPRAANNNNNYGANQTGDVIPNPAQQDRMIIKNANMTIVVEDPKTAMNQVTALADIFGGYIVSSSISEHQNYEGKTYYSADLYFRVPSASFEEALQDIQDIAISVEYQNVTGQDVTGEYVDLESELRSLESAAATLTTIMEEARKTEDVLNVFRELQRMESNIEVIKGRMKYLKESSSFSSITVNFQAKVTVEPITIGKWSPKGIAAEALQALVNFLIWFLIFILPILVVIGLAVWLVVIILKALFKAFKKNSKGKKKNKDKNKEHKHEDKKELKE